MSLQVWLPFNYNSGYKNLGVANVRVTNTKTTMSNGGIIGTRAVFSGSNQYVKVDNYSNFGENFTISLFLYTYDGEGFIFCNRSIAYGGVAVYLDAGQLIIDAVSENPSETTRWYTNYTFTTDDYYHLTITRNATTISYYINGIYQASKQVNYDGSTYGNCITIGVRNIDGSSLSSYFNGVMQDVRIYNHELSASEIKEISLGLAAHYKMDSVYNDILQDSSGYKNNMVLVGSPTLVDGSPRYSKAMHFNKGQYARFTRYSKTTGQGWMPYFRLTATLWVRYTSSSRTGNILSCQQTGGWAIAPTYGQVYEDGGYVTASLPLSTAVSNKWYMVTLVFDRTTITTYIDGELYLTKDTEKNASITYQNAPLMIAAEPNNSYTPADSNFVGDISDVRIYGTALTAQDIKQLYQEALSVNKMGDVHAYEIVEDSLNLQLPTDYTLLDYITLDNTVVVINSIDSYASDNLIVKTEFMDYTYHQYYHIYDTDYTNETTNILRLIQGNSGGHYYANNNARTNKSTSVYTDGLNTWKRVVSAHTLITVNNIATEMNTTQGSTNSATAMNIGDSRHKVSFSYFGIYKNEIPLVVLLPCKRNSDSVYGFYDTVNKTFLTSTTPSSVTGTTNNLHDITYYSKYLNNHTIDRTGIFTDVEFSENYLSQLAPYDNNLYFESDGSVWVRVFHHSNPASAIFASSDTFSTKVYRDVNRWACFGIFNELNSYEFIVKQKLEATSAEVTYRWIQTVNPLTAVWGDVDRADVTYNDRREYSVPASNWGGIYKKNSSTYLSQNNGTSSSWWGAIGAWKAYNGGIPSFGRNDIVVTTGYIDLYVRIDNQFKAGNTFQKYNINNTWYSPYIKEK